MQKCNRHINGFTLLEVMVATAILAVGLTIICSSFSTAVHSLSIVKGYEEARIEGESVMSGILGDMPLVPFEKSGNCVNLIGGSWKAEGLTDTMLKGVAVLKVTVTFPSVGKTRTLTLETAQVEEILPAQTVRKGS